jgi:hypothetical protein
MGAEYAHRLAALDQQGLIVLEPAQCGNDALVTLPVPGCLAPASIHNQLFRPFRDARIEVVHQHSERGLLMPTLTGDGGARRCPDRV